MSITYEISPLTDEVVQTYLRLLPEIGHDIERGKLAWKFQNNPAGSGVLALARSEGRIVGMNGFQPARLRVDGKLRLGFQSLDTIVDASARGKGVFVGLIRAFYDAAPTLGADLIYGTPNQNSAHGFFTKLDWTRLGTAPLVIKPLRTGYALRRLLRLNLDVPLSLLGPGPADIVRLERFDDSVDRLWDSLANSLDCAVERNAAYLNWRFMDHPTVGYETHALRDASGGVEAFVTVQVQERAQGAVAFVMEALGREGSPTLAVLLKGVLGRLKRSGVGLVMAWSAPHHPNHAAITGAGFVYVPNRLRPLALNVGARNLMGNEVLPIERPENWYLTFADADTL